MKKLFLATALVLISSTTFANEVSSEKINNFLSSQKKVQKLIKKQSKKYACSEFLITEVKTKAELLEVQSDLNACISDKSCDNGPLFSKIELALVNSTIKLFKDGANTLIYSKSECSEGADQKGVTVIIGSDVNEKLSLVFASKY